MQFGHDAAKQAEVLAPLSTYSLCLAVKYLSRVCI